MSSIVNGKKYRKIKYDLTKVYGMIKLTIITIRGFRAKALSRIYLIDTARLKLAESPLSALALKIWKNKSNN